MDFTIIAEEGYNEGHNVWVPESTDDMMVVQLFTPAGSQFLPAYHVLDVMGIDNVRVIITVI